MPNLHHLAQVNVARMLGPLDSSVMSEFAEQLPAVNALAEKSEGFVWRLIEATNARPFDDPLTLINLSVWESVESLREFAHRGDHLASLRDRARWFERPRQAHMALWWIPAGHLPDVKEAAERLEFRRQHGDTAIAFAFSKPCSKPEEPVASRLVPVVDLDGREFAAGENTANGDVDSNTRFHYRQIGSRIWATYNGGPVRFGTLIAAADQAGRLDMRYQHMDARGNLRTGTCLSIPQLLPDGSVRLFEDWRWTNGDLSTGRSVLQEIRALSASN